MNIEPQQLILLVAIGISTIATIYGVFKGDTDLTIKSQKKTVKLINKLQKKHKKTEQKYIKEEKKLKELNQNVNNIESK